MTSRKYLQSQQKIPAWTKILPTREERAKEEDSTVGSALQMMPCLQRAQKYLIIQYVIDHRLLTSIAWTPSDLLCDSVLVST